MTTPYKTNACSACFKIWIITFLLFAVLCSCDKPADRQAATPVPKSLVPVIESKEHLDKIIANSGDRLLMIDFYADWCPPCKELNPILEEIAKENPSKVLIYKIDTDKNRDLSQDYRVTGIPHVVFIKNKETLLSLSGLYPKKMYLRVIDRYASPFAAKKPQ